MEENSSQKNYNPKNFYTPLDEAISEIKRRHEDGELLKKIQDFLADDIPAHFKRKEPILYMARHIATPNYEALRFIELGKKYNLPMVIGQDSKGKFVSHNELKRCLGKLPVTKGVSRRNDEIVENFTIVDFLADQGKPFNQITTKHGKNLVDFHNNFFEKIYPGEVEIIDESDWIDRNHRDDLKEQYKKQLALCVGFGILFESFPDNEQDIVDKAIGPAFDEVMAYFGLKPIICEHIDPELELTRDWNGYPSVFYQFIKRDIEGKI